MEGIIRINVYIVVSTTIGLYNNTCICNVVVSTMINLCVDIVFTVIVHTSTTW